MKKLLSLVLICAMGLGMVSCVESEESPSVEAIRNAKAEQLKALANYYTAQAEAEKILANAEAALKAAEAAYQQALAAAKQAEADQIEAEIKMAQDKFAVELAQLQAEAEAAIKEALYNAAQWEEKIAALAHEKISALYVQYDSYAHAVAYAKQDLIKAKADLAKAEADIVDIVAAQEQIIADETANIAQYEAELAVLKASETSSLLNTDSLKVEKQKALVAWIEARDAYYANEAVALANAKKASQAAVDGFFEALDELPAGTYITDQTSGGKNIWWPSEGRGRDSYISVKVSEVGLNDLTVNSSYAALAKAVETAKKNVTAAETALATAEAAAAEWAEAETANAAAIKALGKAWEAYNAAPVDTKTAKAALDAAKKAYKADTTTLTSYKKALAAAQTLVPALEEYVESIKAANKALEAAVKADTEAQKEVDKAAAEMAKYTDQTSSEYKVAKAAYDVAVANKAITAQEVALAELDVDKAELAYATFAVKAKVDDDPATALAAAKADVESYTAKVYEQEIKVLASEKAVAEAQAAYDKAAASVVDPAEVAAALVKADADAKATMAALSALYKKYNTKANGDILSGYVSTATVVVLMDANQDGKPDFTESNTSDVYATTEATYYVSASKTAMKDMVAAKNNAVLVAKDNLTRAENNLAKADEDVDLDEYKAQVVAAIEAVNAMIPSVNEAVAAYNAANEVAGAAWKNVQTLEGKYYGFSEAQNSNNVTCEVARLETAIENAQAKIAAAEKVLASMDVAKTIAYKEAYIEYLKESIAHLEAEVEHLAAMMEHAKAELDAAIAAHQGE